MDFEIVASTLNVLVQSTDMDLILNPRGSHGDI